ncbi:hsp90-like protein [Stagonosporopsis vannaccii]|nr:hsp90-like protein [Stagonosporopsis vannaccii]
MSSNVQPEPTPPIANTLSSAGAGAQGNAESDWTLSIAETDHIRLFRGTDWTRNGLGPLKDWDPTLRLFANFVFADPRAACLWWGPDYVAIYNDQFAPMCHGVHPTLMGSTYAEGFPEIWPHIRAMFNDSMKTGIGRNVTSDAPLLVERNGWKEEAFFTGSFVPIGPYSNPLGFYNSVYEVTDQKLAERRTSMLNKLAAVPAQTVDAVISHIFATLATNSNDVPLAMLYQARDDCEVVTLQLQGQIGLPEGHKLLIDVAELTSSQGLIPDLRRAGSEVVFIDHDDRFEGVSWKGWGEPSRKIAILPIRSLDRAHGYLIFGTNPYRAFDGACRQFADDLNRMISTLFTAAVNFELAESRREQLESDLAFSNLKVRHLVDHASVGMCHVSAEGNMLWANEHYYRLAGRSAEEHVAEFSFFDVYPEEELPAVKEIWNQVLSGVEHVSIESRLRRTYTTPNGEEVPASIQIIAFPYRDTETGRVKSVMACTTDISRLKWAETVHARSAAEAREAKDKQEAFIDVVSHEMRNPLGAIMHCADAIIAVDEERKLISTSIEYSEILADNKQNAAVILQCAKHQRRIIDDVLTLSKLNSTMLSITPSAVEPATLVGSITRMFENEMEKASIRWEVNADSSLAEHSIGRVYLDPSRVAQILINLLTNAIKFVKTSDSPSIVIRYGACLSNPRRFFPDKMLWADGVPSVNVDGSEWGAGRQICLAFSIEDSGIGLSTDDIARIFQRFTQASIKTHATYGGSGLGLFISKELAEKQGGEIGVTSTPGKGSTFGFYVQARCQENELDIETKSVRGNKDPCPEPPQLHVLLVEDNMINQRVLSKQLRRLGCDVVVANHGLEALEILEKTTFDVVLMDSEMPVLDGLSATRRIRQMESQGEGLVGSAMAHGQRPGKRLPILAVTANVREEQIKEALNAGSVRLPFTLKGTCFLTVLKDKVIGKPFRVRDLLEEMRLLTIYSPT